MKYLLCADGRTDSDGAPYVQHSERLADPLNDFTRTLAGVTKKRSKTEADHIEIAHIEFLGGLYTNDNGPCVPAFNVLRCLQEGAQRHKRGRDVLRGVFPRVDSADLIYDGPRDPEELWKDGAFSLRKTVGVQRSRTMRTRPIFIDWQFQLLAEVDAKIFDLDTLRLCWAEAGKYVGLGEMRPIYGRFTGTVIEAPEEDQ